MNTTIETATMRERIEHLFAVISGERFLKMEGYNEVPFFICPYRPHESVEMERLQRQLINQLEHSGVQVLEVNLYDLSIEILKEEDDFQFYIEDEPNLTKTKFLEDFQSILDVEGVIIPHIADLLNAASCQVLILTGVGEVYPYLRSHNILNNLQSTAKTHPTLMFFPGEYTHSLEHGASLDLFAPARKLADDNDKYYRAYNIYEFEA
jgi:hypothetical protein